MVLVSLATHPDWLTSRQLAELQGSDTTRRVLTRYGAALRTLRNVGYAIPTGTIPSGRQNTPAIIYQITDAGRKYIDTREPRQLLISGQDRGKRQEGCGPSRHDRIAPDVAGLPALISEVRCEPDFRDVEYSLRWY